jgi:glutamate--cysteine ligase catalytic subunit
MGFLFASKSLKWEESLELLKYIRDHGIEQFLNTFHAVKSVKEDLLRWGDEIEYGVVHFEGGPESPHRRVQASLRSASIIEDLKRIDEHGQMHGLSESDRFTWMPEYGSWMLESTPGKPYEGLTSLLEIQDNMMMRRSRLLSCLDPSEIVPTLSCFPMLGVGKSTYPHFAPKGPVADSLFIPDEAIFPHPRFPTLTRNIRKRRGEKVKIAKPKFVDRNTVIDKSISSDATIPQSVAEADALPFVYADAMAFGMGCCSLQTTFQAKDLAESRHLYDHLAALTPVMLALTAATPILRGWLMDEDCRWDIVAESVDDRTRAERGLETSDSGDSRMAGNGTRRLAKSRFGPIDCYMCNCKNGESQASRVAEYNDVPLVYDQDHFDRLVRSGVDEVLAQHVAHLFARDPLVIFPDRVNLNDRVESDHWESLQSTNWQTVRWKPPPSHKGVMDTRSEHHIGWRVEFRSMEIQMTDFENAAFVVFIVLLSRVILGLELNTYIPISKLDENMRTAHKRNAVLEQKFWFRSNLMPDEVERGSCWAPDGSRPAASCELMTVEEIMTGKGTHFPGLVPLCRTYLDFVGCDSITRAKVDTYLDFICDRASGKLMTNAAWIRQFVRSHPDYKFDSRVPQTVAYDLLMAAKDIGEGKRHEPLLTGDNKLPRIKAGMNPFRYVHASNMHSVESDVASAAKTACREMNTCRAQLLGTYVNRALAKKVDSADTELKTKIAAVETLTREIQELTSNIELMRSSSSKIAASAPNISSPNEIPH